MKPILTKHQVKFLVGTLIYAALLALLWIALLVFDDWRIVIGGMLLIGFITWGLALAALLKPTRLLTLLLAAGLCAAPAKAEAPLIQRTDPNNTVLYVCCVIVVGGIVIYVVYKICKALPTIRKNLKNLNTNDVDQAGGPILTNRPAVALHMPAGANLLTEDWQQVPLTLQSSTNRTNWDDHYSMTSYAGPNLIVSVLYSNSLPIETNMAPVYWTNDAVFINFKTMPTNVTEPVMMWRAVER